ncbi:ATP/GTP-binding protein [Staphylococcus aureus]|nr:ATP/GTP-binding protein [Staphylococcus aureus]
MIQVAKDTNAIIVYTLIKPEMKQYMSEKVAEFQLKSVDIMGPLMDLLSASVEEKTL